MIEQKSNLDKNQDLKIFFDFIEDFLFVLDLSGNILHGNRAARERLGYSLQELLTMNVLQLHPSKRQEEANMILEEMDHKERQICPLPLISRTGEHIPVETKIAHGKWYDKDALLAVSREISQDLKILKNDRSYRQSLETMVKERTLQLIKKARDSEIELVQRIKIEDEIKRKLELEQIVSDIGFRFVENHDTEKAIDLALKTLCNFTNSCRCYFFRIDYDKNTTSNKNEWCISEVAPQKENLQDIPLEAITWWMEQLKKDGEINVPDVSKMPPSADSEKEILERQGVKSLHVFAILINGKIGGFVGFDNCKTTGSWRNSDLISLRMFASILGNALSKDMYFQQVIQSKARYQAIVEDKNHLVIRLDADFNITFTNNSVKKYFGFENRELMGKNIQELLPKRKTTNLKILLKNLSITEQLGEWEEKSLNAEKKVSWIGWRYSGIFSDNGELREIQFIGRDITDKKIAEESVAQIPLNEVIHRQNAVK